jgi:hypothetical protein
LHDVQEVFGEDPGQIGFRVVRGQRLEKADRLVPPRQGLAGALQALSGVFDILAANHPLLAAEPNFLAFVRGLVGVGQLFPILADLDEVRLVADHPGQPPELRGYLFGQGQLHRADGLQVFEDSGAVGLPFLGGFPRDDGLQGPEPVAEGVEPGGLDPLPGLRPGRLEGVPTVRFGSRFCGHGMYHRGSITIE